MTTYLYDAAIALIAIWGFYRGHEMHVRPDRERARLAHPSNGTARSPYVRGESRG